MKLASVLTFISAAVAAVTTEASINTNVLHPRFHGRFLQEKAEIATELEQWEASEYAKAAAEFTGSNDLHESAGMDQEEKLQRFFATKMQAEEMSRLNPEAEFSTKTPFALWTDEEFAAYVSRGYGSSEEPSFITEEAPEPEEDLHEDSSVIDWSTSGCVAPVKNQGKCGNCWSFGGTASVESFHCLNNNRKLVTFSEQELTSCDRSDNGCDGGWGENVVSYIARNGICTDKDYPYTSGTTKVSGECLLNKLRCNRVYPRIQNYYTLPRGSDYYMTGYLRRQPISVSLAAGNPAFRTYTSGVLSACPTQKIDHVVLTVGYGNINGTDHYRIKNSWGPNWGMNGYIHLKRNAGGNGACEMLSSPFFPY
ncbi:TPA: hypothetical protein N0F65_005010 [Lagenidium giganteum]|uniref:Peptidase C1A papain C-terminal domain-containing protein n=1 Tax=Lagenidium giganteum TaxID=4803 RepID=A0AAV2ZHY7_9STRA|nr:TPA: hypothetical protein N0F65_005010 [Lagenidium giganteum]